LAHDAHVTDSAGNQYQIDATSASQLESLDLGAGEGVPTLQQLVAWAAGRCAVMADMKCEGGTVETQVVELLSPLPNTMRIVPGAGFESRMRFREIDSALPLSLSLDASIGEQLRLNFDVADLLDSIDTEAVTWQHPLLNAQTVDALKSRGFEVYAWTVDDMEIAQRLIAYGVDGIISNRADLLAGLYSDSALG
jgi:glycerophosphoryl diester phosphodiesterase